MDRAWLVLTALSMVSSCAFLNAFAADATRPDTPNASSAETYRIVEVDGDEDGVDFDLSVLEPIQKKLDANPANQYRILAEATRQPGIDETFLVACVWKLGKIKDVRALNDLSTIAAGSESDRVKQYAFHAMADIGGQKGGECLLAQLDREKEVNARFAIFSLLADMKFTPALAKMTELMKLDQREYYWQPMFVFGKMGDSAVPCLLNLINDEDDNLRMSAYTMLGWLAESKAVAPLEERYWKEKDSQGRQAILSAIERGVSDLAGVKKFLGQVVEKEQDPEALKFAKESIDALNALEEQVTAYKGQKKVNAEVFAKEYDKLYKSRGHEGDPEILGVASTIQDEPKLKALRERILQRGSDEAFYDYEKVNRVIICNRLVEQAPAHAPAAPSEK